MPHTPGNFTVDIRLETGVSPKTTEKFPTYTADAVL
jgi:hypothetical protein